MSTSKAQTIKENVLLFEDILEDLQAGLRYYVMLCRMYRIYSHLTLAL